MSIIEENLKLLRLERELEEFKLKMFNTTNVNACGASSEVMLAELMKIKTSNNFKVYGGNVKGFDIKDEVTGLTYEIKSTRSSVKTPHYGNLIDKSADYTIFIRWKYEKEEIEYCLLYPTEIVKSNLTGNKHIFSSKSIKNTRHLAEDMTEEFKKLIAKYNIK